MSIHGNHVGRHTGDFYRGGHHPGRGLRNVSRTVVASPVVARTVVASRLRDIPAEYLSIISPEDRAAIIAGSLQPSVAIAKYRPILLQRTVVSGAVAGGIHHGHHRGQFHHYSAHRTHGHR